MLEIIKRHFHTHILMYEICQKTGHKLKTLSRVIPLIDFPKKENYLMVSSYHNFVIVN